MNGNDNEQPSTAELIHALHRAGWSIGNTAFDYPDRGRVWVVSGTNGENRIVAEGATELDAWLAACEQARACGMFRSS